MEDVIGRIRSCIDLTGKQQGQIAEAVGLTPAQFSKSLSGNRSLSAVELASLATAFEVSLHWLLTGREDPMAIRVAARHDFDPANGGYHAPGHGSDEQLLNDVALLYRQAYPA